MSATWVNCDSPAPSYFGGWVADMGLYIGPNPIDPPAIIDGQDEVDFYIMLPNPADPTNVTLVGDGTYSTPLWSAYRYDSSPNTPPTQTGFFTRGLGVADPTAATHIPAGAHLYVGVNDKAPHPPSYYVPASYARLGRAEFITEPGKWSVWRAGPVVKHAAAHSYATGMFHDWYAHVNESPTMRALSNGDAYTSEVHSGTYPVPATTVESFVPAATASMRSHLVSADDNFDANHHVWDIVETIDSGVNLADPGDTRFSEHTYVQVGAIQSRDGWQASTRLDQVGEGLVYGADYADPPFPDDAPYYAYGGFWHSAPRPTVTWLNISNYLVAERVDYRIVEDTNVYLEFDDKMNVYVGVPPLIDMNGHSYGPTVIDFGTDGHPIWVNADASGLTRVGQPALTVMINTVPFVGNAYLDSVPLPLSTAIPAGSFDIAIVWEPIWTHAGLPPVPSLPDAPEPTGFGVGHGVGGQFAPVVALNPSVLYSDPIRMWPGQNADGLGIPYMAHNPNWRYWIPGAIVPTPRLVGTGKPKPRAVDFW